MLTACIIARNEERRLEACLDSLSGVVNEVVLVDTGSVDSTIEIAEAYGCVVLEVLWCDDFSAPRNTAIQAASGDWVLSIDVDERLQHFPLDALDSDALAQDVDVVSGVWVSKQPRLFRRHPGVYWERSIHESLVPSLRRLGVLERNSSGARLLHVGYDDMGTRERKMRRNLRLLEMWLREHPEDIWAREKSENTRRRLQAL